MKILRRLKRLFRWSSLSLAILLFFLSVKITLSFPLVEQGKKLYQSQQYQEAAQIWQKAADDFASQGDALNQAMALSNLALSEQQLGKWNQATSNLNLSLNLLESLKNTSEKQQILASTLDIQGQLQLAIGQPTLALETWIKAANVYREIGARNHLTRNQINQAQAMQDLGLYPRACDTLLTTLEIEHQSCTISEQQLQQFTKATPIEILGLRSLGNVLRVLGQTEQSQEVLVISGQLARQIGDTQNLTAIYLSLGNTARAMGERKKEQEISLNEPVECLEKSSDHFLSKAAVCYRQAASFPTTQLQAQLNLLSLSALIQPSEVPILISDIRANLTTLPPSQTSITAHLKLAQNLICLQSKDSLSQPKSPILQQCPSIQPVSTNTTSWLEIEQIVRYAYQQAQLLENQRGEANALGYLGEIAQQQGNLTQAQQLTIQALQLLSAMNSPHLTYLWQWQLGHLYQIQGETQKAIKSYTLAFENLQSLRSDLVATNRDIQFTFRDSVEPVYRELVSLLLQDQTPSQENLNFARNVIEALQIAELNNFFQEACLDAKPQSIEQLDPNAAIIYPIILPNRLAVIVSVANQPLHYYTTTFKETDDIENTYNDLLANLNPFISSPEPLRSHQQFYDWLIRPIRSELEQSGIKTLVFVLDGLLRNIPMAALHDGQQYLIEQYNVVLAPGLQLINPRSFNRKDLRTLVGGLAEARQGFSPLPGVKKEVQDIARIVPTAVFLDGEFTSDRIKSEIASTTFPVVHLATHGQFSSQADQTFLLTWDQRVNVKDINQLLTEREQDPIELLVLSACQTAAGDQRSALGIAGFAVRSGARSTVATLWSVQDQSTASLITRFYFVLNQPQMTKAEALRQAQLTLLRSSQYQHPYYWAPFVLVGNWL
ncbi:CHAT domain-containing protein [Chroococcus sp. FPU101]|uniref:CHAT domain-containing protein n=1 Tax=Chroococcus sp. FPU101 TaxID=1974212 RepID=UPI001A8F6FCD|nr:CHAT domain-containing protein [Chroococcus sp. FPU101]GFE69523.1 Tetratricopeptide domain protein [Chroococcus sp. FPU101]